MVGVLRRIEHEFIELLPAAAFFFVAFNLIVLTDTLTTEQYGIRVFTFLSATLGAIVVAKAVLLANLLPFVEVFRERPLIYGTLWRSFLYILASLVVRYIEHLIRFLREYGGFVSANRHMIAEIDWPRFWAIQIWLAVLFIVFAALQQLSMALGRGRLRQMFFGQSASKRP